MYSIHLGIITLIFSEHHQYEILTATNNNMFFFVSVMMKPPTCRPGNGPQFDGEFLHNITREVLKDTRLSQTLTNVVIPTFDIKRQKPVIFSNYKVSSICIWYNFLY